MKSVGEVMAIGRTFKQALVERAFAAWKPARRSARRNSTTHLIPQKLITPTPDRLDYIRFAFEVGLHGGARFTR